MAVTLGPAFKSLSEAHRLGFSKLLLAYAQAKSREVEQLVFLHPKTKNKIGTFSSGRFEWERPNKASRERGFLNSHSMPILNLAFVNRYVLARLLANIDLAWAANTALWILSHFTPLSDPAW